QPLGRFGAGGHDLEVITAGEDPFLALDDYHRTVLLGPVQGGIERLEQLGRQGVGLAIIQRQYGNTTGKTVGNQLAHPGTRIDYYQPATSQHTSGSLPR